MEDYHEDWLEFKEQSFEASKVEKLQYTSDFLRSLQNAPESLRKPDLLPKLDIIHDVPVPQREPSERGEHSGGYSNIHQGMDADPFVPEFINAFRVNLINSLEKGYTEERLQEILSLIFDKAVAEPVFCVHYANLCKHLASNVKSVNNDNAEHGAEKELEFTTLLLNLCQEKIDRKMTEAIEFDRKQAIIDDTTDEDQKKLLIGELKGEIREAKKQNLGNINLIGELYLLEMLKADVIISCVESLLCDGDEESLKFLCTLLMDTGLKLENDVKEFEQKNNLKRDSLLSPCFSALVGFVNKSKTSARVRFMIQDVLDMRDNGWKERDKRREEEVVRLKYYSQEKRGESMKNSGDYRNQNSKDVNMMLKNLKNTSTEHSNMQFGPGNFGAFWSQARRGGIHQKPESQMSSSRQMGNRPMSFQQRAPSSRGSSMKRESQKPAVEITHEELERRSMAAILEYLSNNNTKDGITEDIQSFCNDKNFHDFVTTAVNHALDVSSHQHQLAVGGLFVHLFVRKLFSKELFYLGLDEILQMADDIVVDVPKFFDYMGNILSPFYVNLDDSIRKQFFVTALKSCTANGCGAKLMSYVLKSACQSTTQNKVGSLWRSAGFNWCEFLSANENEQQFIEKNDLQFTVNPGSSDGDNQRLIDNKLIDREKFFANITRKVQTNPSNSNNEELLELIEKSFESGEDKTDPNFVSSLVKAVVQGCVNSNKVNGELSYSFDEKRLETKCAILANYCDNDEVREMKCLCALQQLAEELEHPAKLLHSIFTTLHDQNVISSKAFLAWEKTDSTSQGKAVAVLSVKQFLTWLKEPEDYSDN